MIEETTAKAIKAYKEEFTERPIEYVHGDYISFLSQQIKVAYRQGCKDVIEEADNEAYKFIVPVTLGYKFNRTKFKNYLTDKFLSN